MNFFCDASLKRRVGTKIKPVTVDRHNNGIIVLQLYNINSTLISIENLSITYYIRPWYLPYCDVDSDGPQFIVFYIILPT